MDFREAVTRLTERHTRADLARELGVSFASVKQALLPETSAATRPPPAGWPAVLARLADERAERLQELAAELRAAEG